jgi:ribonuclease HI
MDQAQALLQAGSEEIRIHGDGSFHHSIGLGAWAFRVAEFGLNRGAVETGSGVEVFEFAAILRGIEAVLGLDGTARPMHVYSDSQFVQTVFLPLLRKEPLPERKTFNRIRDLYSVAERHLANRRIRFSKVSRNDADHRQCHNLARTTLREHIRGNNDLAIDDALKQEAKRYTSLTKERATLETRLRVIEDDLLLSETRSQALLSSRGNCSSAAVSCERLGELSVT